MPSVGDLDRLPTEAFMEAVAPLFEGAPAFLRRLADARPFGSVDGLFDRATAIALSMPEADQVELLDAHPRLGAPPASVSAASFHEQGYDRDGPAAGAVEPVEAEADAAERERTRVAGELERLNDAYEAHNGFRYCVFVAGRTRAALLPDFEAALDEDRASELARGLAAIVDIARDRYATLAGAGRGVT
jgi:2-oxo-4-hydroxy-4-carboxy-5-ureidoimidazoline decarboxylase